MSFQIAAAIYNDPLIKKIIHTGDFYRQSIIALHGWTGDEGSMEPITKAIRVPNTRWILPQAPYPLEQKGFSWFSGSGESGWKFQKSFNLLDKIIEREREQGKGTERIFLLGFSQGATLAMIYTASRKFSLGWIISIAGFIRNAGKFRKKATKANNKTPILLIHGTKDQIIPVEESYKTHDLYQNLGFPSELHVFNTEHKIPLKATNLIRNFILNRL